MRSTRMVKGIAAIAVGIATAIGLWALGLIFGLNGEQWDWWRWTAWVAAGLVLIAAVIRATMPTSLPSPMRRWIVLPVTLSGAALVVVAVVVMARRYSDPYSGPLFWPHALAIIVFLGFAVIVVGALLYSTPRGRT